MSKRRSGPKTYLVTGGAGFIGSHLAEALLRDGHQVLALDNLSTGRRRNLAHLSKNPRFRFVQGEIGDERAVNRLAAQADVIVHLAAAVGVQLIVAHPVRTIETNVSGAMTVLAAARRHACRVLIASSSEVYGKGSRIPFREEDDVLLGPTSKSRWAYAASKMLDEFLGLAYHRECGLEAVPFRLFNTVGSRQTGRYGMVVPRFVRQALSGRPLTIFGDGTQSRCFCDVRDIVRALLGLAEHPKAPGQVYNIGGTDELSIRDLAARVKRLTGSRSKIAFVPYAKAYAPGFEDLQRRVPDVSRIRKLLAWRPEHSLEQTLSAVIAYEKARA